MAKQTEMNCAIYKKFYLEIIMHLKRISRNIRNVWNIKHDDIMFVLKHVCQVLIISGSSKDISVFWPPADSLLNNISVIFIPSFNLDLKIVFWQRCYWIDWILKSSLSLHLFLNLLTVQILMYLVKTILIFNLFKNNVVKKL